MSKLTDEQVDQAYLYLARQNGKSEEEREQIENVMRCIEEFAEQRIKIRRLVEEYRILPLEGRI